jgi:hypothetical protein
MEKLNYPAILITRTGTNQCSTAQEYVRPTLSKTKTLQKESRRTWLRFASEIASEMRRATCSASVNAFTMGECVHNGKSSAMQHLGVNIERFRFIIEVATG